MSEYRRYNLTLTVVDPFARDRFRMLSRPESFFEIRPNRIPGQRGAYSVEMTQSEYEAALEDAANPDVNLINIEQAMRGYDLTPPGSTAMQYLAAENADSLGLTGAGVDVGIIEGGYGYAGTKTSTPPNPDNALDDFLVGRVKAAKGFGMTGPIQDQVPVDPRKGGTGHGVEMISLCVPPKSQVVAAAYSGPTLPDGTGSGNDAFTAALYWMVDEIGVDIVSVSQGFPAESTVVEDALKHARGSNVIIFVAAGNAGDNTAYGPGQPIVSYPARSPWVRAISNYYTATDTIAFTSNYGNEIWAASAGGVVENYVAIDIPPYNAVSEVIDDGGTSAATAIASHIAARFMTGGRSPGNVESYLADNARATAAGPLYEGAGVLQLEAAEQALQQDKPDQIDLNGDPIPAPDSGGTGGSAAGDPAQDGTANPDPGACG